MAEYLKEYINAAELEASVSSALSVHGSTRLELLRLIRKKGPVSRAQLAKELKLSKSTVTENIAFLLESGALVEVGAGRSQNMGGRKPILLEINEGCQYIIAAELGLQKPIFALTGLKGRILCQQSVSIPESSPYPFRLKTVAETIRHLLKESGLLQKQIAIIALSSPGAYSSFYQAFLLNPEFENWNVMQLALDLKKTFSTKVFLVNDVNSAAVGELFFGAGRGAQNILYIGCGVGVGAGLILGGNLYTGSYGSAGEIALISPPGISGSLLTKVEMGYLLKRIRTDMPTPIQDTLGKPIKELDFHDVVQLWQSGDPFVVGCINDVAVALAESAAFIVSLLNCEKVIFGGEYLAFEDQILPVLNSILQKKAFDPISVVPAFLREESGLQGLLALSIDALLSHIAGCSNTNPHLKSHY